MPQSTESERRNWSLRLLSALDSQPLQQLILERFDHNTEHARMLVATAASAIECQLRETLLQNIHDLDEIPRTKPKRRYERWGKTNEEVRQRVFSAMIDQPRNRYRLRDLPTSAWRFVGKGERALWPSMEALNTDFAHWRGALTVVSPQSDLPQP